MVFAVTEPLPNLNLLDRFLVMMERQEIPVIICFNKIDLSGGKEIEELRAIYRWAGYTLHFISTYEAAGLEKLHELIAGKTTVLASPFRCRQVVNHQLSAAGGQDGNRCCQ